MTQQKETIVTFDETKHLVGTWAESGILRKLTHKCGREDRLDAICQLGRRIARSEQKQRSEVRIVLTGQGFECFIEPTPRIVNHHDRHDRRNGLLVRLHDGSRLAAPIACIGSPI